MTESLVMPIEFLRPLDFLVGNWESLSTDDKGQPVARKITYQWILSGHFLAAESSRAGSNSLVEMKLFYLWNPMTQCVNAWTIGSDGSWNQAWVDLGERTAKLHVQGVNAGGDPIRLLSILTGTSPDGRTEDWQEIVVCGQHIPSPPPIFWQRI